jgi:hypothetical protein
MEATMRNTTNTDYTNSLYDNSSPLTFFVRSSRLSALIKDLIGRLLPQPASLVPSGSHTTPSSTFNRSLQTKHLPSSLNHLLAHSSCPKCPHTGNNTPISPSLNWAKQMGHFVTRTPNNESLSLTFPSFVVRLDSTVIGAGRRVERASEGAAGDLAGPRNWAMWLNPYMSVILLLGKSQRKRG